jgi:hypothetical protein
MRTYHEYLTEGEDFDTEIVYELGDLQIGDEVFWSGGWQSVYKDGSDSITVGLPGKLQIVKQSDISRLNQGILRKVPKY